MSVLTFWKIDPVSNEGTPATEVTSHKPIFLYLDGNDGFSRNGSKKNLNQALRSFVQDHGISPDSYELYVPTLASEAQGAHQNRAQLRYDMSDHAKALVDFLMPEIPASSEELKLFFSRITVAGYSHGCEEAQNMVNAFKRKLIDSKQFGSSQIDDAMASLAIVNIAKTKKYNLPDNKPVATYTIVSAEDKAAFPQATARSPAMEHESTDGWKWQQHESISHTLQDNHLVVIDASGDMSLRAVQLAKNRDDAPSFASRIPQGSLPDWNIVDIGKGAFDGHHLYLYTNTNARFIPDKKVEVFQSMASAPLTVGIIEKLIKASVQATAEKPRDAAGIMRHAAEVDLLPEAKALLKSRFEASKTSYNTVMGR